MECGGIEFGEANVVWAAGDGVLRQFTEVDGFTDFSGQGIESLTVFRTIDKPERFRADAELEVFTGLGTPCSVRHAAPPFTAGGAHGGEAAAVDTFIHAGQ